MHKCMYAFIMLEVLFCSVPNVIGCWDILTFLPGSSLRILCIGLENVLTLKNLT